MKHRNCTLLLTACGMIAGGLFQSVAAQTDIDPDAAATSLAAVRQTIRLNRDWRFHRGEVAATDELSNRIAVDDWRYLVVEANAADAAKLCAPDLEMSGNGWQAAKTGDDVFKNRVGSCWFRAVLPKMNDDGPVVHFAGVDDNATVYLNGRKLESHQGYGQPFDVELKAAWKINGPNVLGVLVENTQGMGWTSAIDSWTWPEQPNKITVDVYSGCDEVELFLNGRSLAKKKFSKDDWCKYINSWEVPYEPGELKAIGIKNGRQVAEHALKSAGKAAKVKLAAVGNSNPLADLQHDYHGATATTYDGRCLWVVRSTAKSGPITITAGSDGLAQGTATILSEAAHAGTTR